MVEGMLKMSRNYSVLLKQESLVEFHSHAESCAYHQFSNSIIPQYQNGIVFSRTYNLEFLEG